MAAWRLAILLTVCILNAGDRIGMSWESADARCARWFNHAEFENAQYLAEAEYRAWRGQPRSIPYWRFRIALAESLIELDRINDALPLLTDAAPSSEMEARRLSDLAMVRFRSGQYDLTLQSIASATRVVSPAEGEVVAKIDLVRGMLQMKREQMPDAEISLRHALAAVEGSDSLIEAYTLSDLGFLDLRRFRYDEALYWFGRARDIATRDGLRRAQEVALVNLGATYRNLGDLDRAAANLSSALPLAETLHDRFYQMPLLTLLGETWYESGDLTKAAESYKRAQALANPDRDKEWLADVLNDLSQIALKKGDLASAEDLNSQGTALAQHLEGQQALLAHRVQSAAIAMARHDYSKAEGIYRETLGASLQSEDPVDAFQCHAGLAALYRETGKGPDAEREYRAGTAAIDALHSSLQQDESKFSLLSSLIDFYRDYVDFLFDRGDSSGAFQVAQSCRARVLEERLHRDGKGDQTADLKSLETEAHASGATLLSYWLAPKRSLLWVIDSAGHLHTFELPSEAEIGTRVRRYNEAIQGVDGAGANDAGRWLFTNLLAAHYRPPQKSNVVIEPDGALHQLNFEALPADNGGHYWIEDATISIAPSLALLRRSTYVPGGRLLVFGDPGYDGTEFQRLSNVTAELAAVENHFVHPAVYVASNATPAAYRASHPESYSTLHFASHAVANRESPLDSAIVLAGPADNRKLYAREILQQHLTAELVTLSACQTAGSRTYYGEGLTGFSWAFLSAGARNVVAGLWDVDDRATTSLMKNFYDQLAAGLSPASALRRAKLELMASGGPYRKPRYWAAFETFTKALYQ
jgi:tetratricopeptide (TPR) repeat protein